MVNLLARKWGWVALRGALALLFGVFTLFNPRLTIGALVVLFGAYVLVDGILNVATALARQGQRHWMLLLLGGLAGVAAGIITFLQPAMTATVLLMLVAGWAIVVGLSELVSAFRLRREGAGEWLLALAGVLTVLFGVLLLSRPGAGAIAMALWLGAYATVLGVVLLALAWRLRGWAREHDVGGVGGTDRARAP